MMHANMRDLSKLKPRKKYKLLKVPKEKFQFEFFEHTIGFVCLALMMTTTGVQGIGTRSHTLRRKTEQEYASCSASEALLKLKQRK